MLAGLIVIPAAVMVCGCSSGPDEAQLKQLSDLKEEVASLQKDSTAKEQQKATLEKEIADKNARLKKCNDDQQVVRQRLAAGETKH